MAGAPVGEEAEKEKLFLSSRPLHNFTLPTQLTWGNQKQLRCSKPAPSGHRSPNSADHRRHGSSSSSPVPTTLRKTTKEKSPIPSSEIEAVREKLISDLKVAADQIKLPINEENKNKPSEEELPWNLRNRRNVGSSSLKKGLNGLAAADKGEACGSGEQPPARPKFSLTLTKEEIEEDFIKMTGAKPPRRPKKRGKNVQKQLNALVPGGWLTEVMPENYNTPPDRKV